MPCYHPIKAYRSKALTVNGKRSLVFNQKDSTGDVLEIPCGQCIGCRLERSRQWAVRISNEASLYDQNCFITLTYAPEYLPEGGSLVLEHFQKFLKRLRKKYGKSIRFFHCGEYGEQLGRPHYHACILNFDFPDKYHYRTTARGDRIFRSPSLEQLWPFGNSEIGTVTFESAAYVARYCTKKVTGSLAENHYSRLDAETGEIIQLKPEYVTMSRRPGIGAPWLEKFSRDVYNHDLMVSRGHVMRPPRFYDNRFEILDADRFASVQRSRLEKQIDDFKTGNLSKKLRDNTHERRIVKERVHELTVNASLNRNYEKKE